MTTVDLVDTQRAAQTAPTAPEPATSGAEARGIQRIIVSGYRAQRARHFVLTINEPKDGTDDGRHAQAASARLWLGNVLRDVDLYVNSDKRKNGNDAAVSVNIGFTYRGLQRLKLAPKFLSVFDVKAPAFVEGAFLRAARRLGDTGESDADFWEQPFKPNAAHVLLLLHAETEQALTEKVAQLSNYPGAKALSGWNTPFDAEHITKTPDDRRAHFGLKDGLTRVHIEGIHKPGKPNLHKPGEFLLGHINDSEFNPWVLAKQPDEVAAFFRDGSFGVLRKMEQDEAAFNAFVGVCAASLGRSRQYVIAKLVGRWPDGQVVDVKSQLEPSSVLPDGTLPGDDFDFSKDESGFGCPFGSHIRRMNPRNDTVVPFRKRPLIRRGMPYGKPFAKGDEFEKRGLMGLFFCASIEDQFEHLVGAWGERNPMGVNNQGDARDPIAGNHGSAPSVFDIPMSDATSLKVTGFGPFVTTKGTVYAFFPSWRALETMARSL